MRARYEARVFRPVPRFLVAVLSFAVTAEVVREGLAPGLWRPPASRARKQGRASSLSGAWSGAYSYPTNTLPGPVPFNALLEDAAGAITGTIDEPNTFAPSDAPRLFATVVGTRDGLRVSFIKTMDGTGGKSHSIHYEGDVRSDFERIDGRWTIPGNWSGAFFMERTGVAAEEAARRAEQA